MSQKITKKIIFLVRCYHYHNQVIKMQLTYDKYDYQCKYLYKHIYFVKKNTNKN